MIEERDPTGRAAGDRHRMRRYLEACDPDTRISHLAHEAWNRLAELELALRQEPTA